MAWLRLLIRTVGLTLLCAALTPVSSAPLLDLQAPAPGRVVVRASGLPDGNLVLQRTTNAVTGPWISTHATTVVGTPAFSFPEQAASGTANLFRTLLNGPRPKLARYVHAQSGNDGNDGLAPETAFRSIGRAVEDIPTVLAAAYDIVLAPGVYQGSVEVIRAGSASDLSPEDVFRYPLEELPVVRILGPADGGASIRATAGRDSALRFMNVSVALRDLDVEAAGANGIALTGGSMVLENVRVSCPAKAGAGIFCHRSNLYLGGTNSITGPFATGISLRTYSLARPGTRDLPQHMSLDIDGAVQGLFLRDFSTFTSTFNSATIRCRNLDFAVYAILGSNIFFTGGDGEVFLDTDNVRTVFHLTHRSEANVHNLRLTRLRDHFCVGTLMSIVAVEGGTVPPNLVITNLDSTCFLRIPAAWGATTLKP